MIPDQWRYAWHNSGDPAIASLRCLADSVASARPRLTWSVPSGDGVVLGYGGDPLGLTYVLPFLEKRRGQAGSRGHSPVTWARLDASAARPGPGDGPGIEILMVGCSEWHARQAVFKNLLVMPFRITLVVPVAAGAPEVLGRISRKARQQHQRELRSMDRALEIAVSDADFGQFYDRMHLPTMADRHGDLARSEPRDLAYSCLFRRGVLFFLREGGQRVAGMLCRPERTTLVMRLAGVADGDQAYRSGVTMSLYILILQWAAEHGFASVDLSGCEPFLTKGTFQFKRKLHPEVRLPDNHFRHRRLLLRPQCDSGAVRDFLAANPVLAFGRDGGFEAVCFGDEVRPARSDLPWKTPGVTALRLVHLDEFLAGLPQLSHGAGGDHSAGGDHGAGGNHGA